MNIGRVLRKIFKSTPSFLEHLKNHGCDCRGDVILDGYVTIQKWDAESKIILGDGVVLNNVPESNMAGIVHECRFVTMRKGAEIHIGDKCGLSGITIICADRVIIGNNVALGANVTIYDNDMHAINPYYRLYNNDEYTKSKAVIIEDYAWVGAHAIILKGVHIGKGAVIGAGSLVATNVPDYTIYAGNPAKYVGNVEITSEQKKMLL